MLSITHIDGLDSHVKSIDDKLRPTLRTTIDVLPHNDESFDTVAMHWPKGDTIAYDACVMRCAYVFSRLYNHWCTVENGQNLAIFPNVYILHGLFVWNMHFFLRVFL